MENEQADARTGRLNPSSETNFLGTYGDRGIFIFPVQLTTTSRIGKPYPADPYSVLRAQCGEDGVGRRKNGPTVYRATSGRLA